MFEVLISLLLSSGILSGANGWKEIEYDRDGDLSLEDLVSKYRPFKLSTHELILSDGYIIKVFRFKRKGSDELKPILFLHGLSGCSDSFLLDKKKALPFFLADQGYDIWLINNRGTIHSLGHTTFNSSTKDYWRFSWEEIGMIDMPATIDLILANNKHDKVALLGHSEGSFEIFAGLAELPQYNEKVAISFHFGGSAYHSTCDSKILRIGCRNNGPIHEFLERIGITQLMPVPYLREMIVSLCRLDTFTDTCREFAFDALFITRDSFDDFKDISFVFSKWLCGGGVQEFMHFFQTGISGEFSRFDYGPSENMKIYNTTKPPRFHLERITSPTAIFCGELDLYCQQKDIEKARSEIPNVVFTKMMENFGHVDFLLDKQLKRYIYDDMLRLLNEYFK